jgi:hypothetical protein
VPFSRSSTDPPRLQGRQHQNEAVSLLDPFLSPSITLGDDSPRYRRKLAAAKRLNGKARLRALGKLYIARMKDLAPVVVTRTYNNRYFFSARVDPKSLVYKSVYSDWSIPALALK